MRSQWRGGGEEEEEERKFKSPCQEVTFHTFCPLYAPIEETWGSKKMQALPGRLYLCILSNSAGLKYHIRLSFNSVHQLFWLLTIVGLQVDQPRGKNLPLLQMAPQPLLPESHAT